ncbi:MAG TPA: VOC family protein [Solirubrobacterales bacterium]|nr:VOC family protein [Solirubrobacterales bacterium]
MGQPVVHFEIVGKDASALRSFYSELAGWEFDTVEGGPTDYSVVARDANLNSDGVGIGGGVGAGPEGYDGHVTFYIEVPDVGAALDRVEQLGGTKMMGPDTPMEGLTIGLFTDPEGHTIGLVQGQQS